MAARRQVWCRIDELAVGDGREMQVRPGRTSRHADEADQLALAHVAADGLPAREARQMGIERRELLRVADLHGEAVLEEAALVLDDAVSRRIDRLADARFVVDAVVKAATRQAAIIAPRSEWRG